MSVSSVNNLAGCCTTFHRTAYSAVHWIGDNMKTAGTACWEALKKAASYVPGLFARLGILLYQGALAIRGSAVSLMNQMKNYLCVHQRDLKILSIGAAGALAITALVWVLSSKPSSAEPVEVPPSPASPSKVDHPFKPSAPPQN